MPTTPLFSTGTVKLGAAPTTTLTAEDGINQVYSVDLDGDGSSDLVVLGASWPGSSGLHQPGFVMFGDGRGGYLPPDYTRFPALASSHVREVAFGDFNGDKQLDVFVADTGPDAPPYPGAQNHFYLSTPDGKWRDATANLPVAVDFTHSAAAGDVNSDGNLDIVVGNSGLPSFMYVLFGDGKGSFRADREFLPTAAGELLDPRQRNSLSELVTDLDADGRADLVLGTGTGNGSTSQIPAQVLWSNAGSFESPVVTNLPLPARFGQQAVVPLTHDIQQLDINFDGHQDLLLTWIQSVPLGGFELQVLINDGKRGFSDQTTTFIPDASARSSTDFYWVQFLFPHDFNGDGRTDFFIDSRGGTKPDSMPIAMIHQPDGTFSLIRQGDTGWRFGEFAQFAWWPGGTGIIDARATGTVAKFNSPVRGDMFNITFTTSATRWVGGTAAADSLIGSATTDDMAGFAGNDRIDGGAGIDIARYQSTRAAAVLNSTNAGFVITTSTDGTDTLSNIERLQFTDVKLALDLNGNAGNVAKLIGGLFGKATLAQKELVGLGLSLLDKGVAYSALVAAAVQTPLFEQLADGRSHGQFVDLIYKNVMGSAPDANTRAALIGMLERGDHTQASLALLACETPQNAQQIGLVGLASTGIEYL